MDDQQRRPHRRPVSLTPTAAAWFLAPAILLLSQGARAQLAATVYALGQYQYNSNVFDLQGNFPVFAAPSWAASVGIARKGGNFHHQDQYLSYGAGLNLRDQLSRQTVFVNATFTQFNYDTFTQLNHYEYNGSVGWNWQFGDDWTGTVTVNRSRTMVPFFEFTTLNLRSAVDQLFVSTDQNERASLDYQFIPTWHFGADAYTDRDDAPQPLQPNLSLQDSGMDFTLRFLGGAGVTGGITAGFQTGHYANAILFQSPSYHQWSYGIVAGYQPEGPMGSNTVSFNLGHTTRTSPQGVNDVSGWTGSLGYNRQLTGKTSIALGAVRNVSSFPSGAGAELDSALDASALWQATDKIGVNIGYTWLYSQFPGEIIGRAERGDHLQFATLSVSYAALQWLTIRPYADIQTRSSNLYGANFNDSIFGVVVTVGWQNRAAAGTFGPLVPGIGAAGAPVGLPVAVP